MATHSRRCTAFSEEERQRTMIRWETRMNTCRRHPAWRQRSACGGRQELAVCGFPRDLEIMQTNFALFAGSTHCNTESTASQEGSDPSVSCKAPLQPRKWRQKSEKRGLLARRRPRVKQAGSSSGLVCLMVVLYSCSSLPSPAQVSVCARLSASLLSTVWRSALSIVYT